jgi:hypothetical protein
MQRAYFNLIERKGGRDINLPLPILNREVENKGLRDEIAVM